MVTYKVLENHPQDSRIKIKEDGIFQTMGCRGGMEYEPHTLLVLEIRTDEMNETTGTLSPGAHAGSYNGQDAYNDMLVVEDGYKHKQNGLSHKSNNGQGKCVGGIGLQGSTDSYEGGAR